MPTWTHWNNFADLPLRDVVELSCDVEPGDLDTSRGERFLPPAVRERLLEVNNRQRIAMSHVASEALTVRVAGERLFVKLTDFRAWGEALPHPFTFPDEFPRVRTSDKPGSKPHSRWPWGDHESELLKHLAAAGERFWKNYDPNDPSTANTNDTVSSWLESQGVAKRVAEVMAQILRADGLKTGPR